ncbi:hypothetical protein [Alkaliphilus hydrothermalis]|uniref:Uncharacterized protein n=1 Tax=Alkaliphilus hydrothermalis TaxID=1482730 RepID=A0ABS2NV35_9FIRM|nr:hypothetical protein [Alkaliphilus hydrothermalis]MBM7616434.1 hypothetical protein [Alkaliphilus hydrothermalis]
MITDKEIFNIIHSSRSIENKTELVYLHQKKCNNILLTFRESFKNYVISNWSDTESANCCEMKILLHENQGLLDDDKLLLSCLGGTRRDLRIFFSLISNYCFYFIEETEFDEENSIWKFTQVSEEELNSNIKLLLTQLIRELGYKKLDSESAKRIISDVQMEFVDDGNVTVFHCLFTDLVDLFDSKTVQE